jgi:hypothetical protein
MGKLSHNLETQIAQSRLVKKLQAENSRLRSRVVDLTTEIGRLGEMVNVCTYTHTLKICSTCCCFRKNGENK